MLENITIDGYVINFSFLEKAVEVIQTFKNNEGDGDFVCPLCGSLAHIKRQKASRSSRMGTLAECTGCKQKIIS